MVFIKIIKRAMKLARAPVRLLVFFVSYAKVRTWKQDRFEVNFKDCNPFLFDATVETEFDRHYIYHTAWASRIIFASGVKVHHDFSSSLYFVGITSTFTKINFYDYRKADIQLPNVTTEKADLLNLEFENGSLSSVSCLHVLEHIGLGRYGDSLCQDGDLIAAKNLVGLVKSGGQLLIAVPIGGRAHIKYNANRIYTYAQVIEMFSGVRLRSCALITDTGRSKHFIENASESLFNSQVHGCGCFHFIKD